MFWESAETKFVSENDLTRAEEEKGKLPRD